MVLLRSKLIHVGHIGLVLEMFLFHFSERREREIERFTGERERLLCVVVGVDMAVASFCLGLGLIHRPSLTRLQVIR